MLCSGERRERWFLYGTGCALVFSCTLNRLGERKGGWAGQSFCRSENGVIFAGRSSMFEKFDPNFKDQFKECVRRSQCQERYKRESNGGS